MPVSLDAPPPLLSLRVPLRTLVAAIVRLEKRRLGEVGLRLSDDLELRALNRTWRRIDRATDVISFAYDEEAPDAATGPVSGDLAISMDRVAEQAKRFRVRPGAELARLVVHGTLHLCGHDHAAAGERRAMRAREEAGLRAVRAQVRELERRMTATTRGRVR